MFVAYENETDNKLKQHLKEIKKENVEISIAIVIGPEGGLDNSDVLKMQDNGAKVITLGKRILRTETVALNMISNIMYELDN
ncbi:Ribosomal RNA small subunit methyltransferase E [compost metagenome]